MCVCAPESEIVIGVWADRADAVVAATQLANAVRPAIILVRDRADAVEYTQEF